MILASGQRREFLEKPLSYLFSNDLALQTAPLGFFPGGVRIEATGKGNDLSPSPAAVRDNPSRAFHVRGDNTVLGNDAIEGTVIWFSESLQVSAHNDVAGSEARIVIRTLDDALIWTSWRGKIRLGRMGYRRLLRGKVRGELPGASSFEARAAISARFETDSGKYRWLCERQCVGYGRVGIVEGKIVSARYDFYSTL